MSERSYSNTMGDVLGFTYPKLHKGKDWYIDFYAFDPAMGKLRRKKYMLSNIPKITERRRRSDELIEGLTRKLRSGWNPWVESDGVRGYTLFDECLERYVDYVCKMGRKETIQNYTSRVKVLRDYVSTRTLPIKYVYQFDSAFVTDFLDWAYLDRENSPRTVNNYRGWLFSLAEFFIRRKYIKENPVKEIKALKEDDKYRKDLTPAMLKKMHRHLKKTDPHFLLACLMEYYTFIRPTELSFLKLSDFNLKECTVFVSKVFSKNKRDAFVGLNETIIKLMISLEIFKYPGNFYLFGKDFIPGETRLGPDRFNKRWTKMRKVLKWDDCYQFYSLKDSGIRDLANSEGVVVARDQARHTDITTTNKYIQGGGMKVHAETKTFRGSLDEDIDGSSYNE